MPLYASGLPRLGTCWLQRELNALVKLFAEVVTAGDLGINAQEVEQNLSQAGGVS